MIYRIVRTAAVAMWRLLTSSVVGVDRAPVEAPHWRTCVKNVRFTAGEIFR